MKRLSVIALAVAVCCLTTWTALAGPEGAGPDRKSAAWKKKVAAYRARMAEKKAKRQAARDKRAKRKARTKRKAKAKSHSKAKKQSPKDMGASADMADMDAEIPAPPAAKDKTTAQAPAKKKTAGTPLNLRADKKPVALKKEPKEGNWWYKGIFLFIAIAGGGLILRKRGGRFQLPKKIAPQLKVVARTSLGVRSELVIAEIEGMRILLGVTPNGISRIENLGAAPNEEMIEADEDFEPLNDMADMAGMADKDERKVQRSQRKPLESRSRGRRNHLFDEDEEDEAPSAANFQTALEDMQRRLEKHETRREGRQDSRPAPARKRRRAASAGRSHRGGGQARSLLRAVHND